MLSSNLALSRRLECAEGHACKQFAEARRQLFPECGSCWIECAGAYAVFDGSHAPTTQTFGLGLFEQITPASLDVIERFFLEKGAQVHHEVSPFAGVSTLELLCSRRYQPIEISNVMFRPVAALARADCGHVRVRLSGPDEAPLWAGISSRGWTHEHPELFASLKHFGVICASRKIAVASWPNLMINPARQPRCLSMKVSLYSPAPPLSPNCAAVDCSLLSCKTA